MECPRCKGYTLVIKNHMGIEVDACRNCDGMWLDYHELDELEDRVLSDDSVKGSMVYAERASDITCPKCGKRMTTFNYRAYDLPIDFCVDGHGFWLDAGEEKRVLELMKKRIKDLKRVHSAESEWAGFLQGLASGKSSSGGLMGKIKGLLE